MSQKSTMCTNWDCVTLGNEPVNLVRNGQKLGMSALFEPNSIAVIGATERVGSVGRTVLENVIQAREKSLMEKKMTIYPVNPTRTTCCGIPCYKSIADCPEPVALVVIVTPARTVKCVVEECGKAKVVCAVIISAGFKEIGEEGLQLELDILKIAQKHNLRLVGPNCLGVIAPHFGLNATFAAGMAYKGNLAFMSQSGAIGTAVLDWSLHQNIGFSGFASIGSMVDVDWSDLISYFGSDSNTNAILIYMETIGNAQKFMTAARNVSSKKPIIVIKAGQTEAAAVAAASHTGSMAGSHDNFLAAMRRAGVLVVDTINDLFDLALLLGKQPLPRGENLLIITNAGGPGVLATDATVLHGGKLAEINTRTVETLNTFLPKAWSHGNPIDILGDATACVYAKTLEYVLEDEKADGALVILTPQSVTDSTGTAREVIAAYDRMQSKGKLSKPIMCSWMGGQAVREGFDMLNNHGIPTFTYPDSAAKSYSKLWQHLQAVKQVNSMPPYDVDIFQCSRSKEQATAIMKAAMTGRRELLSEFESKSVLKAYGIPVVETRVCQSVEEAIASASEIGFPCVLKIHSETITHKSDVGGVHLNLLSKEAVATAFQSVTNVVPESHFQGVTIQPMIHSEGGVELLMGSVCDKQIGPLVVFGAGGCMVEIFRDTCIGVPPLNSTVAQIQIDSTKVSKALKGEQGQRFVKTDMRQLNKLLCRFSQMVTDLNDFILECDINPLLSTRSNGFVALDARIVLRKSGSLVENIPKMSIRPFPTEYVFNDVKGDGRLLTIRPCCPSDISRLEEFYRKVCTTDLMENINKTSDIQSELLRVACADYELLLPFIAIDQATKDILAMCRLCRWPYFQSSGELKIVLRRDSGVNLASILLSKVLEISKIEKITCLQFTAHITDPIFEIVKHNENFKILECDHDPNLITGLFL